MKILLINNHTDFLHNVERALAGHEVEVQIYKPGLQFNHQDKDMVILSGGGGEGYELKDKRQGKLWYEDEMTFIQDCNKPIFGICMGFEVISAAFGAKVEHVGKLVKGFHPTKTTIHGQKHMSLDSLRQYEHHRYAVQRVPAKHFKVLGHSQTGIEIIKHHKRPIFATQFHPEVAGGSVSLVSLISSF